MTAIQLGRMQNPVRGFLHGFAALVSLVGLVALLGRAGKPVSAFSGGVYGTALLAMYVTSAAYHSVPGGAVWKARLQILDHTFIYVLVAGTYTPLLLATSRRGLLALGLVGIWGLVALGVIREVVPGRSRRAVLQLQLLAGLLLLAPTLGMLLEMETTVAALTLAGGATYLLGLWLFVNSRPRLAPGVFSHHEFFHVVVILASVMHFMAVWRILTP
jgi:hemolysin III